MESFRKLGLSEELLKLLEKAHISEPSEIQEKVIPLIIAGKDVIGGSATGSGKTLAFGAGIIDKTQSGHGVQVLILTPTRELAEQVGGVFEKYSNFKRLKVAIVYGGTSISHQINDLRRCDIVVGTPGRMLDHLERGTVNLDHVKVLVLDEADRMLDMGFVKDVETIIRNCPKERQTLLFSATISADIEHIANKHMKNPVAISVDSYISTEQLRQIYYDVPRNMKFSLLVHLLKKEESGLVMVFCNTRHNTDFVGENLRDAGIDSLIIHGGLTQQKRNSIMEKFHDKKVHVLVCTDVAARGLDIKGVSHIYNYDIPKTSSDYIHRIGRTARAGKNGIAVNLLADRDYDNFTAVLKDKSLEIKREELPEIQMVRISLNPVGTHQRNRWDSGDWKARNSQRARHGQNQDSEEQEGRREQQRRYNISGRGGGRRFDGGGAGRAFGGAGGSRGGVKPRRRIAQRTSNYRGGAQRFSGRSNRFGSNRGRNF